MTNNLLQQRARDIVREFPTREDPVERYRRLVELGDAMPRLPAEDRTEENRLPGCQYAVWLRAEYDAAADVLHLRADSDARITRGLAALIVRALGGLPPHLIAIGDLRFLDDIGLRDQLSVHRNNGLSAMIEEVRARARAHLHTGAPEGAATSA